MRAALVLTLAAIALVGGCDRRAEAPRPPAAELHFSFESRTGDAEVALTLPAVLKGQPSLHRMLYDRETSALKTFAAEAKTERAAIGMALPPYSMEVNWRAAAETPRLLSLVRETSSYAGGAHPNSDTSVMLWDKRTGREVAPEALFPAATANAALEQRLCAALKVAKAQRGGAPIGGEYPCPKWKDVDLALDPAPAGKVGGITALFAPYEIGAYAEGAYDVTLPASAVAGAVAPEYRAEFAG